MLSLAEIGPALYGAWRLAHFDPGGMRYFDRSIAGFWRSFQVALLGAPLWIIILGVNLAQMHIGGGWTRVVIAETIGYVIAWVAYPLAAFYLTRYLDRQQDYIGFIVALNWSQLLQLGILMPAHVVASTGILSFDLNLILVLGVELVCLTYEWFITRTALRLTGLGAVGFVVIDFVISNLANQLATLEAYAS